MSEFPPLRGDEDELIRTYTPVLDRRLGYAVNTSAANREDAIAFAWTVFLRRQPDRDGPWKAYLFTIARNEALSLDRRDRDHGTLTRVSDRDHPRPADTDRAHPERQIADPHDPYTERLELADAVALLAQLPEAPRQVAFLRAHGLRWRELQELTGLTRSQLNRRLVRANRALEQLIDERRQAERPLSARVARLRALEQDPPCWLTDELGRPPHGRHARAEALLEWRRAAIAIDRYRNRFGITDTTSALGERPRDPAKGRAHDDARRQIDIDHQPPVARSGAGPPSACQRLAQQPVQLAHVPERERAQKRAQRRRRRDPASQQPARAARPQHVAVIDAVGTQRHREDQRHHLAARVARTGPLGPKAHEPLRQLLDPQPRRERRQQHQPRV